MTMKFEDESLFTAVKKQIHTSNGIAIISTLVIGLFVHLYIYTNLYLGFDASSLYHNDYYWSMQTGRFIGIYVRLLHNKLQTPLLNGYITLLFLAFSSLIICKILKVKKTALIILISAGIVTWPTIISMHCFPYMTSQFTLAILAACIAAHFADRYKYGFIAGIPLVVISMACYQAEWGTCAALLLLCVIRDILDAEISSKKVFIKCIRYFATLVFGFLIYYGLWKYIMKSMDLAPTNFNGMDNMGFDSLLQFWNIVKNTYRTVFKFYLQTNSYSFYPLHLTIIGWLSTLFSICLIPIMIFNRKIYQQPTKLLLLVLSFVLFPVAINCTEVFGKSVGHNVTTFFAFLLPFFFLPMIYSQMEKGLNTLVRKTSILISILALLFCSFNGIYGANVAYLKLEANYHAAVSQVTQYMSLITSQDGYKTSTPIAIVGYPQPPSSLGVGFEWTNDLRGVHQTALVHNYSLSNIFSRFNPTANLVSSLPYAELEQVQMLENFPANGCIIWVDDTLVLKLN